jgi:signal transduction histidine kinase
MPHQVPLFVFTFGVSLVRRFTRSLRAAEDSSRVLEQRVEEKRREIEESYRTQRVLEHERLLGAERDRMIREMHDGLGSQLTATLALIERGRGDPVSLATALRGALDEMRLVINSLDSEPRQIPEVLGVLRPRLLPILEGQGITLGWHVDDATQQRSFGAEESLHVLRIVQEAIGNTLKHARASRIVVEARETETSLLVSVTDDGAGFRQDNVKPGRGLAHMRERAAALKGRLQIVHNTPGTTILLELPRLPTLQ